MINQVTKFDKIFKINIKLYKNFYINTIEYYFFI